MKFQIFFYGKTKYSDWSFLVLPNSFTTKQNKRDTLSKIISTIYRDKSFEEQVTEDLHAFYSFSMDFGKKSKEQETICMKVRKSKQYDIAGIPIWDFIGMVVDKTHENENALKDYLSNHVDFHDIYSEIGEKRYFDYYDYAPKPIPHSEEYDLKSQLKKEGTKANIEQAYQSTINNLCNEITKRDIQHPLVVIIPFSSNKEELFRRVISNLNTEHQLPFIYVVYGPGAECFYDNIIYEDDESKVRLAQLNTKRFKIEPSISNHKPTSSSNETKPQTSPSHSAIGKGKQNRSKENRGIFSTVVKGIKDVPTEANLVLEQPILGDRLSQLDTPKIPKKKHGLKERKTLIIMFLVLLVVLFLSGLAFLWL